MTKKYLWSALCFVLVAGMGWKISQYYKQQADETMVRGHYAFELARQNISRLQKIVLTQKGQTITFYRDGDDWRFQQAADYFVNNDMLAAFYEMINDALIIATSPAKKAALDDLQNNGIKIKIYDDEDNILVDMLMSDQPQKDKSRLAHLEGNSKIYRIAPVRMFSGAAASWVPMPLLAIAQQNIAGIEFGETFISGNVLNEVKAENSVVRKLLSMLGFVAYDGIVRRSDFTAAYSDIEPLVLQVHLNSGLIYRLQLYVFKDAYWLKIGLAMDKIARQDVPLLIEQLQQHYADWVFQLSDEDGEILYSVMAQ